MAGESLLPNIVLFARMLRESGISVGAERIGEAAQALQWVDLGSRDEVYHTLRTLLVFRHEQMPRFDRLFEAFWRAEHARARPAPPNDAGAAEGNAADDKRAQRIHQRRKPRARW